MAANNQLYIFTLVIFILIFPSIFSTEETFSYTSGSDFRRIVKRRSFIDKTMLIKHVLEGPKIKLITAPRRFCKSTNLNMLSAFLSMPVNNVGNRNNKEFYSICTLFNRLKIYNEKQIFDNNLGKHPVLFIKFEFKSSIRSVSIAFEVIQSKIHHIYNQYVYLLNSTRLSMKDKEVCKLWSNSDRYKHTNIDEVRASLLLLSGYLFKHFNRPVFLLLDNYDHLIVKEMFFKEYNTFKYLFNLVTDVLSSLLINNMFIGRAVLTGISNVAGRMLDRENVYDFLGDHSLTGFFGFRSEEVNYLFNKINFCEETAAKGRNWYEGYTSRNRIVLYNPTSILNFLKHKTFAQYWKGGRGVEGLEEMLYYKPVEENIRKLLGVECINKSIDVQNLTLNDITEMRRFILNETNGTATAAPAQNLDSLYFKYLFEHGFLSYGKNGLCIKIPNKEVDDIISKELRYFYMLKYDLHQLKLEQCATFFNKTSYLDHLPNKTKALLDEMNLFYRTFQTMLVRIKTNSGKYPSEEVDLENIMFAVTRYASGFYRKCQFYHELRINYLRVSTICIDVFMYKGPFAVIMEVKHHGNKAPDSKVPLQRILDGKYDDAVKRSQQKIKHYLLIGFSANNEGKLSMSCLYDTKNISQTVTVDKITSQHFF